MTAPDPARQQVLAELDELLHHADAAIKVLGWESTRAALREHLADLLGRCLDAAAEQAEDRRRAMLDGINTAIRRAPATGLPRMFPPDADDDWLYG